MLDAIPTPALWGAAAYHLMTVCVGAVMGAPRSRAAAGAALAFLFGPLGIVMMLMMRDESQEADARRIAEARALAAVERLAGRLSE